MLVSNVNGTAGLACKCGSWLDHWRKYSRQRYEYCGEGSCSARSEVGAHVQKNTAFDRAWYIVPLCTRHNARAASMTLKEGLVLVPADVASTCG